jgi:ABC-type antimicrobial peptide transport system, ATPase component
MATPMLIRAEGLYKQYPTGPGLSFPVLKAIHLVITAGEFAAIMGPSGSGKSTLMNILGCLDIPSGGHYYLNGEDVVSLSRDQLAHVRNRLIGFVFQGFNLLPRLNAEDNIALPLIYAGVSKAKQRARARELLHQVGLPNFAHFLPNQLSGGQQQRIAIARALVNRPVLILADEPTGNLDTHISQEIMELFTQLNEEQGITIVLVTHEPDIARYAKRLVHIVDGRIEHDGKVEETLARLAA